MEEATRGVRHGAVDLLRTVREEFEGHRAKLETRERALREREADVERRVKELDARGAALDRRAARVEDDSSSVQARELWAREEEARLDARAARRREELDAESAALREEREVLERERERLARWEGALRADAERVEARLRQAAERAVRVRDRLRREQRDARALKSLYEPARRALRELDAREKSAWTDLEAALNEERDRARVANDDLQRYRAALELREDQLYREVEKRMASVRRAAGEREAALKDLQEELIREIDERRVSWSELEKTVGERNAAMKALFDRYRGEIARLASIQRDLEARLAEREKAIDDFELSPADLKAWRRAFEELYAKVEVPVERLRDLARFNLPPVYRARFEEVVRDLEELREGLGFVRAYYLEEEPKTATADPVPLVRRAVGRLRPKLRALRVKFKGKLPESGPPCAIDPGMTEAALDRALGWLRELAARGIVIEASSRAADGMFSVTLAASGGVRDVETRRRSLKALGLQTAAGVFKAQGGALVVDAEGAGVTLTFSFPLA